PPAPAAKGGGAPPPVSAVEGEAPLPAAFPAPVPPAPAAKGKSPSSGPTVSEHPTARPVRPAGGAPPAGSSLPPPPAETAPPTVVSVLVVDEVEEQSRVRAALSPERFEILATADPDEALHLAKAAAPDLIVASDAMALGSGDGLVQRLRSDPLTDGIRVLLLTSPGRSADAVALREAGVAEALPKPVEAGPLLRAVGRLTNTLHEGPGGLEPVGDLTVEEVADRVAQEVRRGLVDSVEGERDLRVPLGEGAEVLAAAWSAVGRLRAEVAQRSGGRVRFRDDARRGPAVMALVPEDDGEDTAVAGEVRLSGRRVLVVDDDPAVVWFFAGLLREEGARVQEAADGRQALDLARRFRPDVIISDIVMPEMDGLTLCRELQRDPALCDVPVILLSWKEDYLQRMRELQSGARGYLRKEAASGQILSRVRQVLLPRARLEARLLAGGEVRGRLEGLGVVTVLRTVAESRPDARVTVRDAWNLFEVDLRGGAPVGVTRTATDGSFSRGDAAVVLLVGVTSGRFTVSDASGPVRATVQGSLDEVLDRGVRRLGAMLDAVAGPALPRVAKVELDEGVLDALLGAAAPKERELVERLQQGERPRDLLLEGTAAPQVLQAVLEDLARRGAIRAVRGIDGEDRVAEAIEARGGDAPDEAGPPATSPLPPPPPPQAAAPEAQESDDPELRLGEPSPADHRELAQAERAEVALGAADSLSPPVVEREGRSASPAEDLDAPFGTRGDEAEAFPPRAEPPSPAAAVPPVVHTPPEVEAPPREGRPGWLGWASLALGLAAVGLGGVWLWQQTSGEQPAEGMADERPERAAAMGAQPTGAEEEAVGAAGAAVDPPLEQELSYGRDLPRVEPGAGVAVGEGEGLLVVRSDEPGGEVDVRVDGAPLGDLPARRALAEGRYELELRRGNEVSYRYLYLRRGHTRIITVPDAHGN
ncbi:MAG: response regulator, partial [Myxococcota bacterium]